MLPTTVPDVLLIAKLHRVTDMGPPRHIRPRHYRATDYPTTTSVNHHRRYRSHSRSSDSGSPLSTLPNLKCPLTPTVYPSAELLQCCTVVPHSTAKSTMVAGNPNYPIHDGHGDYHFYAGETDVPRIYTWPQKEILSFDTWCRNHQIFTLPRRDGVFSITFTLLRFCY